MNPGVNNNIQDPLFQQNITDNSVNGNIIDEVPEQLIPVPNPIDVDEIAQDPLFQQNTTDDLGDGYNVGHVPITNSADDDNIGENTGRCGDTKQSLSVVNLDENDALALEIMSTEVQNDLVEDRHDATSNVVNGNDEASTSSNLVTHVWDDEVTYSFDPNQEISPMQLPFQYEIKLNDVLSKNIPFKENVIIL